MTLNKKKIITCFSIFLLLPVTMPVLAVSTTELVHLAMQGDHREPGNVSRDRYRHPAQTLRFFGLEPYMTVVEIWPGKGWYTEILAPVMRDNGIFYTAGFSMTAQRTPQWRKDMQVEYTNKLAANPVYDRVVVTELSVPERTTIAPPGHVDMILTFRNVHNWMKGGYTQGMLEAFYRTLEPGGILGIVEHRAKPETPVEKMIESGYVTEEFIIQLASAIGFEFVASAEINANKKDSKDHPRGVWTLPPTLRLCEEIKEGASKDNCVKKYTSIGESDRMTLKFRKPFD